MKRVRIKELALIAAAGGLLTFEVAGLARALPSLADTLAREGAPGA